MNEMEWREYEQEINGSYSFVPASHYNFHNATSKRGHAEFDLCGSDVWFDRSFNERLVKVRCERSEALGVLN